MDRLASSRISLVLASAAALVGCYEGIDPEDWYANTSLATTFGETGGEAGSGMQDATSDDPSAGDGDGDGDGDPTTTTGDGDGDGDPTTTGD
jgi:hypothetical protein